MKIKDGVVAIVLSVVFSLLILPIGKVFGDEFHGFRTWGERVYWKNCVGCHGIPGERLQFLEGLAPDFDNCEKTNQSPAAMKWAVVYGQANHRIGQSNPAMPAWGGVLTEYDIGQVLEFIRSLCNGDR